MELAQWLDERLRGRNDVHCQTIDKGALRYSLYYLSGAIDLSMLQAYVLRPLIERPIHDAGITVADMFVLGAFFPTPNAVAKTGEEAMGGLLEGQALLCVAGRTDGILFPFHQTTSRSISVSDNEKTIRGPKEAFVEDIWMNLSLLRQRVKSGKLQVRQYSYGTESRTLVMLLYLEGECDPKLVDNVNAKLEAIPQLDRLQGSNVIEEYLDTRFSPFPTLLNTERPDVAASALFEGRILILTDGTPSQMIAPATLLAFMQSAEDYYQGFFFSSWVRILRYLFFFVSLILPSAYVAITTFHPEMLPYNLLISIASSRDIVPFPAIVEALIMELAFEVMREAGQRIPTMIGQTISIVGAIVLGQAAVQAGIVSAPMVIIVAFTGISSFMAPHFSITLGIRFLRFALLFTSAIFGLLGMLIGIFFIYIHLLSLESFGTPYLSPFVPYKKKQMKDAWGRAPWPKLMRKPGKGN
ncbi:spore germination protein [Cohnella sp. GCM10027633]|uniref:spore germination protein n=1 Tax=unclassified Cohnella TaxID=2636738 RepID=UPI0036367823